MSHALFPIAKNPKPQPVQMKRIQDRKITTFTEVDDLPGVPELTMKKLHEKGRFNIKKHKPTYGNVRISYSYYA